MSGSRKASGLTNSTLLDSPEGKRLVWSLGLFFIGLFIPVWFLTPIIVEQALAMKDGERTDVDSGTVIRR